MQNIYVALSKLPGKEEADKGLEEITKKEHQEKTTEQLKNLVELRDYQRKNPIKGFFKEIHYYLTHKI